MSHAAVLRTRGRQAVAAMHLTLGAHGEAFHSAHQLLPARARVAPACQARAQTTDAAVRALPPLRRRYSTHWLPTRPTLGPACPAASTYTATPLAPTAALLNSASLLPTHQIRRVDAVKPALHKLCGVPVQLAQLVAQGWVDGLAEALCQPELHLGLL